MTGLTMSTAEELQVVNYGIGGHYEPHFDFARVSEEERMREGVEKEWPLHLFSRLCTRPERGDEGL